MESKSIVLRINQEKVFFNPQISLPTSSTDIPVQHLKFNSHSDIFWKVNMISFEKDKKTLYVSVQDYDSKEFDLFEKQSQKHRIDSLIFGKFDWQKLQQNLIYYQKVKFSNILFNDDESQKVENESSHSKLKNNLGGYKILESKNKKEFQSSFEDNKFEYARNSISIELSIPMEEINFENGCVTFKLYIKRFEKEFHFEIINEFILPEFNCIKSWFAKKLKIKKVKFSAEFVLQNGFFESIKSHSSDISAITPDLIEDIKYQRTIGLIKEPSYTQTDKALFTAEDIFQQMETNTSAGNVFKQSETDIFRVILQKDNIRNRKQLDYLANHKQSLNQKLRYTLNPLFGFLFFVEGNKSNCFVWELLKSHATYCWRIDKISLSIEEQFKMVDAIINSIRFLGREKYKRLYFENPSLHEIRFKVITHQSDVATNLVDFEKWRGELEDFIK